MNDTCILLFCNMSFYLRYILFCICYIDEKRCDKGEYGDKNN